MALIRNYRRYMGVAYFESMVTSGISATDLHGNRIRHLHIRLLFAAPISVPPPLGGWGEMKEMPNKAAKNDRVCTTLLGANTMQCRRHSTLIMSPHQPWKMNTGTNEGSISEVVYTSRIHSFLEQGDHGGHDPVPYAQSRLIIPSATSSASSTGIGQHRLELSGVVCS